MNWPLVGLCVVVFLAALIFSACISYLTSQALDRWRDDR